MPTAVRHLLLLLLWRRHRSEDNICEGAAGG